MWKIIWQYDKSRIGLLNDKPVSRESLIHSVTHHFDNIELSGDIEPVFPSHPAVLRTTLLELYSNDNFDPVLDLTGYYQAFTSSSSDALRAVSNLRRDPGIRYAEIQPPLYKPVRFSESRPIPKSDFELFPYQGSPDLLAEQGYIKPAPQGVDAEYAWTVPGGRGASIKIIDIEDGWNFQHEDLLCNACGVVFGRASDDDHGTAVLGIFSGDDNCFGVKGIASDAVVSAASATWDDHGQKWNAAAAIYSAADRLKSGDVILLEMHAPGPNSSDDWSTQRGFIPIEYWDTEFAAITYATTKGIHVVEAAGNGGEDLDATVYKQMFTRTVRDSGAILVGGGQSAYSAYPRSRIDWSNYGSRLDLQGWGEHIVTCGGLSATNYYDRWKGPDASHCYTNSFGGTSGASPIVVGAVAIISGVLAAHGRAPLNPLAMRTLLHTTGTPQNGSREFPITERIGPLPNLRAAIATLRVAV